MLPNPKVIAAVEKLNHQVTVADVAAETGLALPIANRELANLASLTLGHLVVSESGEILYKFSPNLRIILLQRSLAARVRETLKQIWRFVFYLIRISFGIVLVISIILVFIAIGVALVVISSSGRQGDSERGGGYRGEWSGGFGGGFWLSPFDIFWLSYDYDRPRVKETSEPKKSRGFLENVFAFLFGDGNPNYDLEERRWRLIAQVIRNHDGVVVGEQILPYLDEIPPGALESEDYMLPVLAKFNGYPEVTPQGGLVYRFPDLQRVASRRPKKEVPVYLEEKRWVFNEAGWGANILSASLGGLYLGGSLVLGSLLADPVVQAQTTGFLGFIQGIYNFLLGYAILFLTIPTVRYLWLQWLNRRIQQRNTIRRQRTQLLNQPPVQEKLAFARQLAIAQTAVAEEQVIYTTEKSLLQQEFEQLFAGEQLLESA
ncbi:MAG: hypothetical protein RMI89_02390 [Gloeomargarita sp. SKYBB_i_bin120]|nr:hypothetical protein [Gloeomargarita sp. SKYB120]MDW8177370.1 hypothetical protein [Gloeomargarita sp. SKYBB_i_bin120]